MFGSQLPAAVVNRRSHHRWRMVVEISCADVEAWVDGCGAWHDGVRPAMVRYWRGADRAARQLSSRASSKTVAFVASRSTERA